MPFITSWAITLLQKVIVALPVTKIHSFYGTLGLITVFIKLATEFYPEPTESGSHSHILSL
jgi:hypothetical protein